MERCATATWLIEVKVEPTPSLTLASPTDAVASALGSISSDSSPKRTCLASLEGSGVAAVPPG